MDIELRAEADTEEAARKNQSEGLQVEPIFYADTAAAQTPVDDCADVKPNIVYDKENPRIKVNECFSYDGGLQDGTETAWNKQGVSGAQSED